jgi:hypothetical protein
MSRRSIGCHKNVVSELRIADRLTALSRRGCQRMSRNSEVEITFAGCFLVAKCLLVTFVDCQISFLLNKEIKGA